LERMANHIWTVKPDAYVILEHFCDNNEEKKLANDGMLIWGNSNYNYAQSTMGWMDGSDFAWISYKKRGWSKPHVMGYMESHDEERLMYKNLTWGNGSGNYSVKNLTTALKRMELAGNFFFTVPGPKMIWQFGERGYDLSINYPCGNESCRTDPKPPRWQYMEDWRRKRLFDVWKTLIDLKKEEPVFSTDNYDLSVGGSVKRIRLQNDDMKVVIVGNFDVVSKQAAPNFYTTGTWYEFWTGDSLEVTDVGQTVTLMPGEYRMYTSKRLESPEYLGVFEQHDAGTGSIKIFPNPAEDKVHLLLDKPGKSSVVRLEVLDLNGKVMMKKEFNRSGRTSEEIILDISSFEQGIYLVKVVTGKTVAVGKWIKR